MSINGRRACAVEASVRGRATLVEDPERIAGWLGDVPLLCARELDVTGAISKVSRNTLSADGKKLECVAVSTGGLASLLSSTRFFVPHLLQSITCIRRLFHFAISGI